MVVSSEELLLKVLKFMMATNPIEKRETLFVLTIPSTTPDLQGAEKFLKAVAKKVNTTVSYLLDVSVLK